VRAKPATLGTQRNRAQTLKGSNKQPQMLLPYGERLR